MASSLLGPDGRPLVPLAPKGVNKNDPTYQQVLEHNRAFLLKIEPQVQEWYRTHKDPKTGKSPNPPIYKDVHGRYFWASRAMRKKKAKENQNGRRSKLKRTKTS